MCIPILPLCVCGPASSYLWEDRAACDVNTLLLTLNKWYHLKFHSKGMVVIEAIHRTTKALPPSKLNVRMTSKRCQNVRSIHSKDILWISSSTELCDGYLRRDQASNENELCYFTKTGCCIDVLMGMEEGQLKEDGKWQGKWKHEGKDKGWKSKGGGGELWSRNKERDKDSSRPIDTSFFLINFSR